MPNQTNDSTSLILAIQHGKLPFCSKVTKLTVLYAVLITSHPFTRSLPHTLTNYELAIALFLIFSKYGRVVLVKASRDQSNRPFGFVEYSESDNGQQGILLAMDESDRLGGICIASRKLRLELAKNTIKLIIRPPEQSNFLKETTKIKELTTRFKLSYISHGADNAYALKLDCNHSELAQFTDFLQSEHPEWSISIHQNSSLASDRNGVELSSSIAECFQRHSGLFQLRIPDSGILPVSPTILAKIQAMSPNLQYSLATTNGLASLALFPETSATTTPPVPLMTRLYEDRLCFPDQIREKSFTDPSEAREALSSISPPLGSRNTDVFFGRLNNLEITMQSFHDYLKRYGAIQFIRVCNRSIIRDDNIPVDSTALVRFNDEFSAAACIRGQNGATWLGRIIKCEKCWPMAPNGI